MGFDTGEADRLLADCGRLCCICRQRHRLQVHHIVPGDDNIENGIPLCPNCHDEVHTGYSQGRITRSYTPSELKEHRRRTMDLVEKQLVPSEAYRSTSAETITEGRGEINISFKKFLSSTGELHKYWLIVTCTNNSAQKQDGYTLEFFFPFDIPVESTECQGERPEKIGEMLFRKFTIHSDEIVYRTQTIQIVDERRHPVVYQMNDNLYDQAKEHWRFRWKFYAGNLPILEGSKPWGEMHCF